MNSSDALDALLFLIPPDPVPAPDDFHEWGVKKAEVSYDAPNGKVIEVGSRAWHLIELMRNGNWYRTSELMGPKTGTEALRRLRELKSYGFQIERRKIKGSSQHEYRLIGVGMDARR